MAFQCWNEKRKFALRSLDEQPPASAIRTMTTINVVIVNPAFLLVFLGTPAVCVALLTTSGGDLPTAAGATVLLVTSEENRAHLLALKVVKKLRVAALAERVGRGRVGARLLGARRVARRVHLAGGVVADRSRARVAGGGGAERRIGRLPRGAPRGRRAGHRRGAARERRGRAGHAGATRLLSQLSIGGKEGDAPSLLRQRRPDGRPAITTRIGNVPVERDPYSLM